MLIWVNSRLVTLIAAVPRARQRYLYPSAVASSNKDHASRGLDVMAFIQLKSCFGIADLHFAMYKGAEIEVTVDGKSMGTFKPVREGGWNNHYFKIKDLDKTGHVKVEFTCRSREAIMDKP